MKWVLVELEPNLFSLLKINLWGENMLEDKIGHRGEGIEDSEIRVRLDPIEYDVGIKVGGLSIDRDGGDPVIA